MNTEKSMLPPDAASRIVLPYIAGFFESSKGKIRRNNDGSYYLTITSTQEHLELIRQRLGFGMIHALVSSSDNGTSEVCLCITKKEDIVMFWMTLKNYLFSKGPELKAVVDSLQTA
jgi:hypothetical protein